MDYYKKMFKPSRPVNDEIPIDIVDELESKWTDMQPKIQESVGDRSKVQKKLAEIRSYIEHCHKFEKEVSEDQQAKIKQIINKCKAALVTYGNISEMNPSSPGAVRKVMPAEIIDQPLQNKVDLTEVEAKLKSMRQKRLYRQSVFVEEQSKLSEERRTRNKEGNEIENAIKSIQQVGVEKKPSFKSISEEHVAESVTKVDYSNVRRSSSGSSDKSRSFSTKKFINRFNCGATKTTDSSNEDLTKEDDNKNSPSMYFKSQVLENRRDSNKTRISLHKDKHPNGNKSNTAGKEPEKVTESSFQDKEDLKDNCSHRSSDTVYNPLLSPVGKQRKAIYLYENECKFLENEKQSSALDFTEFSNTFKQDRPLGSLKVKPKRKIGSLYENWDIIAKTDNEKSLTTFGKTNQEILGKKLDVEPKGNVVPEEKIDTSERGESHTPLTTFDKNTENEAGKKIDTKEKMGFTYKSKKLVANIHSDKSKFASSTFNEPNPEANSKNTDTSSKLTLDNITENKYALASKESENQNDENEITYQNVQFKPKKSNSLTKLFIKSEKAAHRKSDDNLYRSSPLRSPLPLPRKNNNDERILKKLQRNWDSLKQIVENDSDVDGDEIEDMKKTWEEANILLVEYKTKIETLQRKSLDDGERLSEIESQLKDVGEAIKSFRGLRRDAAYKQLSTRLSYCFLTANKVNCSKTEAVNKKNALLREIEKHIKSLEFIVNRNEAMLLEILEDQVKILGTKHFSITKV